MEVGSTHHIMKKDFSTLTGVYQIMKLLELTFFFLSSVSLIFICNADQLKYHYTNVQNTSYQLLTRCLAFTKTAHHPLPFWFPPGLAASKVCHYLWKMHAVTIAKFYAIFTLHFEHDSEPTHKSKPSHHA